MKPGIFFLLLAAGFLFSGSVLKKDDPIVNTQTDPVLYEQLKKEEEEGRKSPASPTFDLFPQQAFLIEDPVGKYIEEQEPAEEISDLELWLEEGGMDGLEPETASEDEFKLDLETDDTT